VFGHNSTYMTTNLHEIITKHRAIISPLDLTKAKAWQAACDAFGSERQSTCDAAYESAKKNWSAAVDAMTAELDAARNIA
jgi:hypothetical protein